MHLLQLLSKYRHIEVICTLGRDDQAKPKERIYENGRLFLPVLKSFSSIIFLSHIQPVRLEPFVCVLNGSVPITTTNLLK